MSTFECACCGPSDAPLSSLASLCDTCAAGSCSQCEGYVYAPESPCARCCGLGTVPAPYWPGEPVEHACSACGGAGYLVDEAHGLTSMSPDWCHYLTLAPDDCCDV